MLAVPVVVVAYFTPGTVGIGKFFDRNDSSTDQFLQDAADWFLFHFFKDLFANGIDVVVVNVPTRGEGIFFIGGVEEIHDTEIRVFVKGGQDPGGT